MKKLIIIVVAVVSLSALAGIFVVMKKSPAEQKATQETESAEQLNERILSEAPKEQLRTYEHSDLKLSFQYPPMGFTEEKTANSIRLKSADFAAASGLSGISAGTTIAVAATATTNPGNTEAELNQLAAQQGAVSNRSFVEVAGRKAVRFEHNSGQNRNSHLIVIFVKDGKQYIVDQQYALKQANPLPPLMNTVTSTLKFK